MVPPARNLLFTNPCLSIDGTIPPALYYYDMMKKIVITLAVSQIALAGGLYAADNVFSGTDHLAAQSPASHRLVVRPVDAPALEGECGTHAWPNIPAQCLNAGGEGMAYSASPVRHIAIN